MQINLAGTNLTLLAEKAIFIPEASILIIADLHLGKAMHFRKAGIFIPKESASKDYEMLDNLISKYHPKQVFFLGDLFHSRHNSEWKQFANFIESQSHIQFTLIKGNHDILALSFYEALNIDVVDDVLPYQDLIFSHEPMDYIPAGKINVAGHIHPGCALKGLARQYLRLPCFYFRNDTLLLPAFGHLTGLQILDPQNAKVFVILNNDVVLL